jgi:hypothetical protein
MKQEHLTIITNELFDFIKNISYDDSRRFRGFQLEMMLNIYKFLSPDSVVIYENNKRILGEANIEESNEPTEYDVYLNRLISDLKDILLNTMQDNNITKTFKIDKIEIIMALSKLLNPKTYYQNIKKLKQEEENQNRLTYKLL